MRIQHNIMAMSAYRNYTNNVSAMKKNLEKLSSGYKINRAGDDAAGLAISEKMRAQITGLETAQKNAKDGISLVQTAEGALTEVHDMLNRMVELATMSANGTYDNTTDRAQLQKEMDQLNSEINRIADSANFNGIKLLDGTMDAEDVVTVNTPDFVNLGKLDSYGDRAQGANGAFGPQLHKDASGSSKTHFEFDFNGRTMTADDSGAVKFDFGILRKDMADGGMPAAFWGTVELNNLGAGATVSAEDLAKAVGEQIPDDGNVMLNFSTNRAPDGGGNAAADPADTEVQVQYKVTVQGSKVIFDMTETGYAAAKDATLDAGSDPFQGNFTIGMWPDVGTTDSTNDIGSSNVTIGSTASGSKLAETVVNLDTILEKDGKVQDGAGVKIGDEYYVFAAKDETLNAKYGDNVKVVDIRDLVADTGAFKSTDDLKDQLGGKISGITRAISRLTEVAKDNKMFDVQHPFGDTAIAITERIDNPSDADLTTKEGIAAAIQKFDGIKANVETKAASGKALTLQIGDTADSYNQLQVNIKDMHAASLGLDKISIADQADAAKAIDVIKAAINKVSDIRGTLGATQNRLDHTINNLSVMQENIQDAESTIRDTDIAAEMMEYTKNNILIQSAQAMLAQANQVPQGVLQLLQ